MSADIETLTNLKVHALPIITSLTVQDTLNVKQLNSIDSSLLKQQYETLERDIPFKVIKLGLLSSIEIVHVVSGILQSQPSIPVVFDPILRAGGGGNLATSDLTQLIEAMQESILPFTTVVTPNTHEANLLSGNNETLPPLNKQAETILNTGCKHVFITGEHENQAEQITNRLFHKDKNNTLQQIDTQWPRLPQQYHGSGCTLAAAISGYLAQGHTVESAIQKAQQFTHNALEQAVSLGKGQYHPYRFTN